MALQQTTDTGRLVWGHPLIAKIKKHGDGPMKGQPVMRDGKQVEQWSYGTAYPKQYFDQYIRPMLMQEAMSGFPSGVPQNFAWKITDGDGVDSQGKPFNQREGYAGCYVLAVSTEQFAPPVYKFENGQYRQLTANEIKCGDYIANSLMYKLNIPTDRTRKPSMYVNPMGVVLVGYGPEIQNSSFDPNESFGAGQFSMPPGASAVPVASAPVGVAMPGQQQIQPHQHTVAVQPQQQPYPVQQPQQQYQQPVQQQYPAPAHDFVQNAGQPQQGFTNAAPVQMQPAPVMQQGAPGVVYATSSPINPQTGQPYPVQQQPYPVRQ